MYRKYLAFILSLLVIGSQQVSAAVTTYDYTFVENDVYSSDFATRLNANFTKALTGGINNVESANIKDDSLLEADFADEINPRVRTAEGASCQNFVTTSSGLLPATGASLTTNIAAGVGYPLGYRVSKASTTAHTYTASKWTWVDLDTLGNFRFTETAFGAADPGVYANSMRLAIVSSDGTTVNTVTDLRVTNCMTGPFNILQNNAGEASLDDILKNGAVGKPTYVGGSVPVGFAQGGYISYNNGTSFKVAPGTFYINGKYRANSLDVTVPITVNVPAMGTSGIVSGSPVASTTYKVYAVADQVASKNFSVSFGTAPSGLTNYREIGQLYTSSDTAFVSHDIVTAHTTDFNTVQKGKVTNAANFTISNLIPGARYRLALNVKWVTATGYPGLTINGDGGANYNWAAAATGASGATSLLMTSGGNQVDIPTPFWTILDFQPLGNYNNVILTSGVVGYMNGGTNYANQVSGKYTGTAGMTSMTITALIGGAMTGDWTLYQIS